MTQIHAPLTSSNDQAATSVSPLGSQATAQNDISMSEREVGFPDSTINLGYSVNSKFVYGIRSHCDEWMLDGLHSVLDAAPGVKGTIELFFMASEAGVQVDVNGRFTAASLRKLADFIDNDCSTAKS